MAFGDLKGGAYATSTAPGRGVSTATTSVTVNENDLVLGVICRRTSDTTDAAVDIYENGDTGRQLTFLTYGASPRNGRTGIWYKLGPSGGYTVTQLTSDHNNTNNDEILMLLVFEGPFDSGMIDQVSWTNYTGVTAGTNSFPSITPTVADSFCLALYSGGNGSDVSGDYAVTSGFTALTETSGLWDGSANSDSFWTNTAGANFSVMQNLMYKVLTSTASVTPQVYNVNGVGGGEWGTLNLIKGASPSSLVYNPRPMQHLLVR